MVILFKEVTWRSRLLLVESLQFFAVSSLSELAILTLYHPLGLMYILLQGSPQDTVMASVALNFILEIDELLFEKFAGQWRIMQIEKVSFQVPYTLKENSKEKDRKDGSPLASESDPNQYEPTSKTKAYEPARICQNSASKLQSLFWRDLLLAIAFTFGVVFGIRILVLDCPSWSDASSETAVLNASTFSNISLTPVQTPDSAKRIEIEVRMSTPSPPPDDAHFDHPNAACDECRPGQQVLRQHDGHLGPILHLLRDGIPQIL